MSDKPTLKLRCCYRGVAHDRLRSVIARKDGTFKRIVQGPLTGCYRLEGTHARDNGPRGVFKLGADYVLEFMLCIRIRA